MIDLPRPGGEKEVLPGCVMCPQPSAGVCTSVTSFDLEMADHSDVDAERAAPGTVASNLGLSGSAVQARANPVKVGGVRAEQNRVGEGKSRSPRGTGAPRFTLLDLNKCRTPLTFTRLLFKIRSQSLGSLPAQGLRGCCSE